MLTQRSDVERDNLEFGFSYMLSERTRIGMNGSYGRTDYESDSNVDYIDSSISVTFIRALGNGKNSLFVQPYYSGNRSFFSRVKNLGLYAGWSGSFSETWSFTAYIGARRTKTGYFILEEKGWGWLADLSLEKKGVTWSAGAGLNRDLKFSSYGDPVESDKLNLSFRKNLSERLRYVFSGSITRTESTGMIYARDTTYYSINNSMYYMIMKDLYLGCTWVKSTNRNELLFAEKSADRNIFLISLSYSLEEIF